MRSARRLYLGAEKVQVRLPAHCPAGTINQEDFGDANCAAQLLDCRLASIFHPEERDVWRDDLLLPSVASQLFCCMQPFGKQHFTPLSVRADQFDEELRPRRRRGEEKIDAGAVCARARGRINWPDAESRF